MRKFKTMRKLLFSATVFAVILAACTKDNYEKDHPPVVTPTPAPNPNPTQTHRDTCNDSIRYNPDVKRILNVNCASVGSGCHEPNNQSPDLSNFTDAHANAERIKVRTCDLKTMPTSGPLTSDCDLNKLKAWFAQGALENR